MTSLLVAAAAAIPLGAVAADDCGQQVQKFADERGISTDLPQGNNGTNSSAAPSTPPQTNSDTLAESGGVIEPPKTDSGMPTFEPSPESGSKMPTAPEVGPEGTRDPLSEKSAKDAQIQALLLAARQAAESGDTQRCFSRLQEAKSIASGNGG